jgi:hypothetical protein
VVELQQLLAALLLTARLLWQPGITEENVRRLRPGMTLADGSLRRCLGW